MESKKWVASIIVVLVGSPFAVAALEAIGITPTWQVEAPEWEAGYSWTYSSSMQQKWDGSGGWMDEEFGGEPVEFRMWGENKRTVVNTTAQKGNTSLYAVVEQWVPVKVVENGEVRYEAEGGEENASEPEDWIDDPGLEGMDTHCTIECPMTHSFYTQSDLNPYAFNGPDEGEESLQLLQFPLRHGASWEVYRNDHDMGGHEGVFEELRARVAGKDVVFLPGMGSMDAVRIEATITKESLGSMEDALMEEVSSAPGFDIDVTWDLDYTLTYWYAPEAKSVVRADLDREEEMSMSFNGQTMRFKGTHRAQEALTDFSLEPGPERSMEEIERMWDYLKDLPGVTALSNETWPFSIAASEYSVDAVEGETVHLGILEGKRGEVATTRFDEIPDGMELMWRHRYLEPLTPSSGDGGVDLEGLRPVEEWYSGESLELSPQSHGLHEITGYLLDDRGRLVALDSTLIEGYGRWTMDGTPTVGLPLTGPYEMRFHANVFMDRVRVDVTPEQVASGNLILEWAYAGQPSQQESRLFTGPGYIERESEAPSLTSSWRVRYEEQARLGDWQMTATVHYDRDAPFEQAELNWEGPPDPPKESGSASEACGPIMAICLLVMMDEDGSPGSLPEKWRASPGGGMSGLLFHRG